MKKFLLTAVLALLLSMSVMIRAQEKAPPPPPPYQVVVNAKNPVKSLTKVQVSAMFLKKTTKWDNGAPILPADLTVSSEVRDAFSNDVHGKSPATIKNYWQQQQFSGAQIPPPELASEQMMIKYVELNPGAIGYVSGTTSIDAEKLTVITVN